MTSGGWGTPRYMGRHRETFDGQDEVFCVEDGCVMPATRLRPVTIPWLYEGGVIGPDDASEWVCSGHATSSRLPSR